MDSNQESNRRDAGGRRGLATGRGRNACCLWLPSRSSTQPSALRRSPCLLLMTGSPFLFTRWKSRARGVVNTARQKSFDVLCLSLHRLVTMNFGTQKPQNAFIACRSQLELVQRGDDKVHIASDCVRNKASCTALNLSTVSGRLHRFIESVWEAQTERSNERRSVGKTKESNAKRSGDSSWWTRPHDQGRSMHGGRRFAVIAAVKRSTGEERLDGRPPGRATSTSPT